MTTQFLKRLQGGECLVLAVAGLLVHLSCDLNQAWVCSPCKDKPGVAIA